MKIPEFKIRTDLALEEPLPGLAGEPGAVLGLFHLRDPALGGDRVRAGPQADKPPPPAQRGRARHRRRKARLPASRPGERRDRRADRRFQRHGAAAGNHAAREHQVRPAGAFAYARRNSPRLRPRDPQPPRGHQDLRRSGARVPRRQVAGSPAARLRG